MKTWSSRRLESTVTEDGLRLSIGRTELAHPGPDELLVRVEAAPINPTDIAALLASADLDEMLQSGGELRAPIAPRVLRWHAARMGRPVVPGYEGAGTVVAAGGSDRAEALLGRVVGMTGGAMYSEYCRVHLDDVMVMAAGVTPREAASHMVNPMAALGMLDTLRAEGHRGLVHTAAASNLGLMLNRLCQQEGIPLVNVVRSAEQVALLRQAGADYVLDSSDEGFRPLLTDALAETGATLAFDAVGGGRLGNTILSCMERAAARHQPGSHYGTEVFKHLYLHGRLDTSRVQLSAAYGFAWSVSGWLMGQFVRRSEPARVQALRQRIAAEITTSFASRYGAEVSLSGAMEPASIRDYSRLATGRKYLLNPSA